MVKTHILCVLLALVSLLQATLGQTGEDFKLLHDELFITRSYRKAVLPRTLRNKAMFISFDDFRLHGIIYLDELQEKLTTMAHLTLQWNDTFLTWNENQFSNISYFYMPQNDVWKPDISIYNGFTKLQELGDDVILVKIYSSGLVQWKPFEVFETQCEMDITKFPFDRQICQLVFRMWASDPADLKFLLNDRTLKLNSYELNGIWDLISTNIELAFGNVIITLTLDRRPEYHLLTLICPVILLSVLSVFTFVIPVDSGEKIGYSMTVYLALAVLMTIFGSTVPVNSRTTSYLAVYVTGLMVKGTVIIMVTAAQVRLHHRPSDDILLPKLQNIIRFYKRMFKCCRKHVKPTDVDVIQTTPSKNKKSDETSRCSSPNVIAKNRSSESTGSLEEKNDGEQDIDEMYLWVDLTTALDRIFFCFFFIVDVILHIMFFKAAL